MDMMARGATGKELEGQERVRLVGASEGRSRERAVGVVC